MFKFPNKGIPTSLGIIIIVAVAIVSVGGVLVWQGWGRVVSQQTPASTPSGTAGQIRTGKVVIDSSKIADLQTSVDSGHQPWRGVVEDVLRVDILSYGFSQNDLDTIKQISFAASAGVAEYQIKHLDKFYIITIIQPVPGQAKIWTISDIEDLTANWKTYANTEYGFEIKYPEEFFEIDEITNNPAQNFANGPKILFQLSLKNNNEEVKLSSISVQIIENRNLLLVEDWYKEYSKFTVSGGIPLNQRETVKIEGITAIKSDEGCCESNKPTIFLPFGNKVYELAVNVSSRIQEKEATQKAESIFYQILSTFKFLPQ